MTPTTRETADHVELARLAEAASETLTGSGWFFLGNDVGSRFINAMSPAVCSALLSEIAALRGERDGLKNRVSCLERLGGEQSTRVMEQATRAKDAERQRDELRKALEGIGSMAPSTCETSLAHDMAQFASQALANQGAE